LLKHASWWVCYHKVFWFLAKDEFDKPVYVLKLCAGCFILLLCRLLKGIGVKATARHCIQWQLSGFCQHILCMILVLYVCCQSTEHA